MLANVSPKEGVKTVKPSGSEVTLPSLISFSSRRMQMWNPAQTHNYNKKFFLGA